MGGTKIFVTDTLLGTHSLPLNVIANLVPVRVADADAKRNEIECSSPAFPQRGPLQEQQQDSKIPTDRTKVSADSFLKKCTDLITQVHAIRLNVQWQIQERGRSCNHPPFVGPTRLFVL